jgi:hypothetical protein
MAGIKLTNDGPGRTYVEFGAEAIKEALIKAAIAASGGDPSALDRYYSNVDISFDAAYEPSASVFLWEKR